MAFHRRRLAKEKGDWGDFEFPPRPPESGQENHFVFPGPFLHRVPAWWNQRYALHAEENGTARRPSTTRKLEFSRRIPNIFVGDGLCAVPVYAPRQIRIDYQISLAAVYRTD